MRIEEVATNIMLARERRGISRKQLATRTGLHSESIRHIETWSSGVTVDLLLAIAAGLGVSPVVFFGGQDDGRCVSRQEVCGNVRAAREKRGISKKELCKRAFITDSTVRSIEENRRNFHIGKLLHIADGLECSPVEFFQGAET